MEADYNEISQGDSNYTLSLEGPQTVEPGSTNNYVLTLTVNSFGSGIFDMHEIVLKLEARNGGTVIQTSRIPENSLEGGSIISVGGTHSEVFTITVEEDPSYDEIQLYVGVEF